jgi:aminoglycoside/choline kinase family phosphotransferase
MKHLSFDQNLGNRDQEIREWLQSVVGAGHRTEPASSDASFRRYLRVYGPDPACILMDAPPERESCLPFVQVQSLLRAAGVNVPEIIEADLDRGLILLSDLGPRCYFDVLDETNCDALYADALKTLHLMQSGVAPGAVPDFDRRELLRELNLFPNWFIGRHLGIEASGELQGIMEACFEALIERCLEQPQVFVHRDYHSRNLMHVAIANPGVLDFQDAVRGPVTYDLVSLFRDVYIRWPGSRVEKWVHDYYTRARSDLDGLDAVSGDSFVRWFDLTGVQRHIKVAGIFCRLWYRDAKPGYLNEIPLTLSYLMDIGRRYPETRRLAETLSSLDVMSRLESANRKVRAAPAAG